MLIHCSEGLPSNKTDHLHVKLKYQHVRTIRDIKISYPAFLSVPSPDAGLVIPKTRWYVHELPMTALTGYLLSLRCPGVFR